MEISITIPSINEVLKAGIPLPICAENEKWNCTCLGNNAKESGVYVHHSNGHILYVGQTSKLGDWSTYQVRLRRECQPKASGYM